MISFSAALILAASFGQAPSGAATWHVTEIAGPSGFEGQKMTLTIGEDDLLLTAKKTSPLRIRASQIRQIVYSPERFSRAGQMVSDKRGDKPTPAFDPSGCGEPGCGGAALMFLVTLAVASTMHGQSHYITVTWEDRGVEQEIQFEIGKNQRADISEHLRQLAPNHWIDVVEQKHRVESLIAEHQQDSLPLTLAKLSACGDYVLPSGDYRMLVSGSDSAPEIYLFAGELDISQLRGVTRAHASDSPAAGPIEYLPDTNRIHAIRWHDKSLVIEGDTE
ncbi:MAG TPA: hypothetical protein VKT75_06830 [Acidobacteriaceae bacterium]|nr:hypothetical protein [Acidobacteriaceae bacterium]